jgi:uncharacterized protein
VSVMNTPRAICLALALCWSLSVQAQIAVPTLSGRVTDETATLSVEQKAALEQTLQTFEARKGTQIAVLMVPTTAPESIEQYALRVAEQWKLGRKKVDDGAVLVVAKADRALRIEVGYGLEGALNDATSERIISEIIAPRFKQGDFYGGLTAGVDQIIRVANGEPLPAPADRPVQGTVGIVQYLPVIFILALIVGGVLRAMLGRLPGALVTGAAVAVIAWLFVGVITSSLIAGVIALLFTLVSGGMGGGYGRRGYGMAGIGAGALGGGGFSAGGGFSGGGGGFGGGGASGRF